MLLRIGCGDWSERGDRLRDEAGLWENGKTGS